MSGSLGKRQVFEADIQGQIREQMFGDDMFAAGDVSLERANARTNIRGNCPRQQMPREDY